MSKPQQTYNNSTSDNELKPIPNIDQTYAEPIAADKPKPMSKPEQTYANSVADNESKTYIKYSANSYQTYNNR